VARQVARHDHDRTVACRPEQVADIAWALVEIYPDGAGPEVGEAVGELARGDVRTRE
jgi:hypothetical protein